MADTPHLTIRCEYPDTDMPPTEVTFRLSPSYGLTTSHEANEWFLEMMRKYEEFEVETDVAGEPPRGGFKAAAIVGFLHVRSRLRLALSACRLERRPSVRRAHLRVFPQIVASVRGGIDIPGRVHGNPMDAFSSFDRTQERSVVGVGDPHFGVDAIGYK